ncbi:hypothetical protein H0G86_002162 [Trichoderma simmonsii]|uniref:2EXR domain-containing protein n=1 Tax=Trichoderma simmonsii TaxID=1491479 RepID=A0A8G0L346_9HYPO|nr:hypothetical protein H0G86_002162 [Trichoderma simmonsii]
MGTESTEPKFPQFPLLPSEIRLRIWYYCLPRRIVQRDDPFYLVEVREEQKCWSIWPTCQNAAVPLIASVCRESRHVVRKWGKLITQDFRSNIGPIWIQPRLDHYNLNCDIRYVWDDEDYVDNMYASHEEAFYRLDMMPVSLRAEYFYPFALEPEQDPFQRCPILEIHGKPSNEFSAEYSLDDPYDEFTTYIERPYAEVSESATLAFICIHATKEQAVDSGLFGILLDAPVQLVDFDDNERLEQFYALFQKGCCNDKRPEVSKQFDSILAPGFRSHVESWREKVDWLMMANAWRRANKRLRNSIPIEGDPGLIWNPPLLEDQTHIYMNSIHDIQGHTFDIHHPWVIQAKKELPRVTPKIQFLLCTDDCDVNGDVGMVPYVPLPLNRRSDWFDNLFYSELAELP